MAKTDAGAQPGHETSNTSCETPTETSNFVALLQRMRYIERWALMRGSRPENLSEHSLDVAVVAHMLATIARVRHGADVDPARCAVVAVYHDASEVVTGDMPTPVKYANPVLRDAYKAVERSAVDSLLDTLPDDLRSSYEQVFRPDGSESDERAFAIAKAADRISALAKCLEERRAGNSEFATAEQSCREAVEASAHDLPEVADFCREFLPSYGMTLDELLGRRTQD